MLDKEWAAPKTIHDSSKSKRNTQSLISVLISLSFFVLVAANNIGFTKPFNGELCILICVLLGGSIMAARQHTLPQKPNSRLTPSAEGLLKYAKVLTVIVIIVIIFQFQITRIVTD